MTTGANIVGDVAVRLRAASERSQHAYMVLITTVQSKQFSEVSKKEGA